MKSSVQFTKTGGENGCPLLSALLVKSVKVTSNVRVVESCVPEAQPVSKEVVTASTAPDKNKVFCFIEKFLISNFAP